MLARGNIKCRRSLTTLVDEGWTLERWLPGIDENLQQQWLGCGWFLMHRSVIETVPRWTACLSSRLGSDKHLKSSWPWLLERFLRSAWRLGQTVLVSEGLNAFGTLQSSTPENTTIVRIRTNFQQAISSDGCDTWPVNIRPGLYEMGRYPVATERTQSAACLLPACFRTGERLPASFALARSIRSLLFEHTDRTVDAIGRKYRQADLRKSA